MQYNRSGSTFFGVGKGKSKGKLVKFNTMISTIQHRSGGTFERNAKGQSIALAQKEIATLEKRRGTG